MGIVFSGTYHSISIHFRIFDSYPRTLTRQTVDLPSFSSFYLFCRCCCICIKSILWRISGSDTLMAHHLSYIPFTRAGRSSSSAFAAVSLGFSRTNRSKLWLIGLQSDSNEKRRPVKRCPSTSESPLSVSTSTVLPSKGTDGDLHNQLRLLFIRVVGFDAENSRFPRIRAGYPRYPRSGVPWMPPSQRYDPQLRPKVMKCGRTEIRGTTVIIKFKYLTFLMDVAGKSMRILGALLHHNTDFLRLIVCYTFFFHVSQNLSAEST